MTVRDARLLYPGVIVRTPDPAKYRAVHLAFRKIFRDYSPDVTPKSIDEAVIDLTDTLPLLKGTVYIPSANEQLEIFASPTHKVAEAMHEINDKWGEFVITPALMMDMDDIILDRISLGGVKELEEYVKVNRDPLLDSALLYFVML